jgi:hypothetical protein
MDKLHRPFRSPTVDRNRRSLIGALALGGLFGVSCTSQSGSPPAQKKMNAKSELTVGPDKAISNVTGLATGEIVAIGADVLMQRDAGVWRSIKPSVGNTWWDAWSSPSGELWVSGKGRIERRVNGQWQSEQPHLDLASTSGDLKFAEYSLMFLHRGAPWVYAGGGQFVRRAEAGWVLERIPELDARTLSAIWTSADGRAFAAVRKSGRDRVEAARFDGTAWVIDDLTAATGVELRAATATAIGGTGSDDVWLVGERRAGLTRSDLRPFALHFDGTRWTDRTPPVRESLTGLAVVSRDTAWCSGYGGQLLRWQAGAWEQIDIGETRHLMDVVALPDGSVLVSVAELRNSPVPREILHVS